MSSLYFSKKQKNHNVSRDITQPQSSGFIESVVSGIGAGIGASVAERAVSSVLGNRTVNVVHRSPDCEDINKIYKEFSEKGDIPETVKEAYSKCNKGT
jgi:hypothetical protein